MSESIGGGGVSFKPNKERGVWSSPHDFAWACLNNAFRIDNLYGITIIPMIVANGFFSVLCWFLIALLYAVPLFFIQSFLGQFSSSGYISALRISPLFKGLGYIGLVVNLVSLAFFSILIAIPLLFLIHSLQPTLPWSCAAPQPWNTTTLNISYVYTSHCNLIDSATTSSIPHRFHERTKLISISSVDFFRHKLNDFNFEIIGCLLIVWAALAYVTYHSSEKIGIIFRYCTIVMVTLLMIVFFRLLFLPGVLQHMGLQQSYRFSRSWILWIVQSSFITFMTFGPGWGSVLSLASYNKFKTNIVKYSWQIPICQFVILILLGLLIDFAEVHLTQDKRWYITESYAMPWMKLMTIPSSLSFIENPHLWTWMFLIMTILGAFNLTLTLMFSTQTALLDEFERLRPFRKELAIGGCAVLAMFSAIFCTTKSLETIGKMYAINLLSQCLINLILIISVLWVYGHERLKRDVEFMTNYVLSKWKLSYIRFVTPVLFTFALSPLLFVPVYIEKFGISFICATLFPWIALVLYCVYRLSQVSGDCRLRFSRCNKPTDWYPVDREDKQRYEEAFGDQETSPTLTTIVS